MFLASFITIVFWLGVYLIPSIIAGARKHKNTTAILAVNLLFGWTILGWGAALVWSLTNSNEAKS